MERPVKKLTWFNPYDVAREKGYNQCVDEFDEYLPNEEEITDFIAKNIWFEHGDSDDIEGIRNLAKVISERIRK